MKEAAELINKSVFELMENIDDIVASYGLTLVADEDKKDYEKSKEEDNTATIYGCIYYDIESEVKRVLTNVVEELIGE